MDQCEKIAKLVRRQRKEFMRTRQAQAYWLQAREHLEDCCAKYERTRAELKEAIAEYKAGGQRLDSDVE